MEVDLQLVRQAQDGNQDALAALVRNIQDDVHHLAMRMLVNPEDAQDATQEILILVITKLSTFEGRSALKTWVYRIAINYLTTAKKMVSRDPGLNFEIFEKDLEHGLVEINNPSQENHVLLNELRVSCTMAMLLCLDVKHRAAYVLGFILELEHDEAAGILGISKVNFRKRLSRARSQVEAFTSRACGLVSNNAKCACPRRLPAAMAAGRVVAGKLVFAGENTPAYKKTVEHAAALEKDLRTLALQKATRRFECPRDFGATVEQILTRQDSIDRS